MAHGETEAEEARVPSAPAAHLPQSQSPVSGRAGEGLRVTSLPGDLGLATFPDSVSSSDKWASGQPQPPWLAFGVS